MNDTVKEITAFLHAVKDPEIPVVDIVEMGIVRDVTIEGGGVEVKLTPTYSGCPAMKMIEDEVVATLTSHGISPVKIKIVYDPPWTTDWLSEAAKKKLKDYGIAPPSVAADQVLVTLGARTETVPCPRCNSKNTRLQSEFGAASCKAMYVCKACLEPFEYFKAI